MIMKDDVQESLTETDVHESLQHLLEQASRNGVDLEGGWVVKTDSTDTEWEIHITEIKRE